MYLADADESLRLANEALLRQQFEHIRAFEGDDLKALLVALFQSEESMGVYYQELPCDTLAMLPFDSGDFGTCTNSARMIVGQLGRGEVCGFSQEDNPTANAHYFNDGHDFAVIDNRLVVDPWISHYTGYRTKSVYDLLEDADEIREIYGDPNCWRVLFN